MDLNKLPFIPPHFFYFQFTSGAKRVFWIMIATLVLAVGMLLLSYHKPFYWALEVFEVNDTSDDMVKIMDAEAGYRTFDVNASAYRHWANYVATPLTPHQIPVTLFWGFMILAWATLLSAASFIRSRWYLLFAALFAVFIHSSKISDVLYYPDKFHLVKAGIVMVFLGLMYMFQVNNLKWTFPYRFITFFVLLFALFGYAQYRGGWIELHRLAVNVYGLLSFIAVLFLFFVGKEITNLWVLITTNYQKSESRQSFPRIMIGFLLIILLEITMYIATTGEFGMKNIMLRPMHLLALASLVTVFTSQNQFHSVKDFLSSTTVYSFAILGWALLAIAFFFFSFATGDTFFIYAADRLAIAFFLGVGIGHIIYLLLEFLPLLKQKINVYYLMGQSRGYMIALMWLFGAVFFVYSEGHRQWISFKILTGTKMLHDGDIIALKEGYPTAEYHYKVAKSLLTYSPRLNYNLAAFHLRNNPKDIAQTVKIYQDASANVMDDEYFPYARLSAGNIYLSQNNFVEAEKLWRADVNLKHNPYALNNLAYVYLKLNKPDSAITCLKKSLLADGNLSSTYSNLAAVYWQNGFKKEAHQFNQLALKNNPTETAIANAIWYSFKDSNQYDIPALKAANVKDFTLQNNYFAYLLKTKRFSESQPFADTLLSNDASLKMKLLVAYQWFMKDSLMKALSFAPQSSSEGCYLLGVGCAQKGMPEMARKYFQKMYEMGDSTGIYYEGLMLADMGQKDSAAMRLNFIRTLNVSDKLKKEVTKESAMLLKSVGQNQAALLDWDFKGVTQKQRIRMAVYADSSNNFVNALNVLREAIDADKKSGQPYWEMGKIYNKYKHPDAVSTLQEGLKREPKSPLLLAEMTKAYLLQGNVAEAEKTFAKIEKANTEIPEVKLIHAQLLSVKGDEAKALTLFQELHKVKPFEKEITIGLSALYLKQNKVDEGYKLIYDALQFNDQAAGLWYYYAHFSRRLSQVRDAGMGIVKAMELTQDTTVKAKMAQEFDRELGELTGENLDEPEKPAEEVEIQLEKK
ncbi:MAG: tetratricopeptide repeat protein [Bacteroidia bacterium]